MKQNTIINRAFWLNITVPGLFLASALSFRVAYAAPGAFMNCYIKPDSPRNVQLFKHSFEQMGSIIFYWGYRPHDGIGDNGMFTIFGMKNFVFSEEPSKPISITVDHNSDNTNETWQLHRSDTDEKNWGGINDWKLTIYNHKTKKKLNGIEISCDEYSQTPQKPKQGDSELTAEAK